MAGLVKLREKGVSNGTQKKRLGYADWYAGQEAEFDKVCLFVFGKTKNDIDKDGDIGFSKGLAAGVGKMVDMLSAIPTETETETKTKTVRPVK